MLSKIRSHELPVYTDQLLRTYQIVRSQRTDRRKLYSAFQDLCYVRSAGNQLFSQIDSLFITATSSPDSFVALFIDYSKNWIVARAKKTLSRSAYKQSRTVELAYRHVQQQLAENQQRILETKLVALRMQMNPHFVFNSLNAINYFILQHEAEQASNYLTKFSKLMRQAMLNMATEWIPLRNELTALQTYVDLELLRSDNAFEMILTISESLNPDDVCIPPMVTYPYVENAIRHGLLQQPIARPVLQINCFSRDGYLMIQIADNGIGRAASMRGQRNGLTAHKSYGHAITTERLQLINDLYGTDSKVDFTDLATNEGISAGTCVTFSMKLKSC